MLRYGCAAEAMRSMDENDVFFSRIKLLIIMAKAFLKGYPVGPFRLLALQNNIQSVFYEALNRSRNTDDHDHLFFQRTQLLAVMCKSIVDGNPLGDYRLQAMRDNIDQLCLSLADHIPIAEIQFLKVA
jgi:hypothetical protein